MNLHGLAFPDDLLYAPEHNLWLREEADSCLTLGLTAYGCALYGQIFAFTPKRDGQRIEQNRSFGVVEFAKAASSARSPLSGILHSSNAEVVRRPALINQDCYGNGWLVRLIADDLALLKTQLLTGAAARQAFAERMARDGFDPQAEGVQVLGD
tara:strand:- start:1027 stop:1488 length:462 start_codon:yes stop_codon:yes gene_type:complete